MLGIEKREKRSRLRFSMFPKNDSDSDSQRIKQNDSDSQFYPKTHVRFRFRFQGLVLSVHLRLLKEVVINVKLLSNLVLMLLTKIEPSQKIHTSPVSNWAKLEKSAKHIHESSQIEVKTLILTVILDSDSDGLHYS